MKTFKRITATTLAVLMVLATLLTVNVFADSVTFPDVADDYYYKDAIYSLVNEGVINGIQQEDGTFLFKPEDTITRAEFAKLVAVATAGNVALTETTTRFPDLAVDHWANTYIAYAVKTGVINGNSDGTFRPENPVSYGEAVKMLVCAKGYGSLYTATEPWYDGYIKIANDIDLTKKAQSLGANEAKRGMVAQLIYNMDYTKKIEISTGGPSISGGSEDDENEEDEGVVVGVFETTLTSENLGLNKFEIMIDDEVYNIGSKTLDAFYPYLGKSIEFEYSEGTGNKKIIEKFNDSGKNDTITITANNIDSVSSSVIEYYESDTSNKLSEAKLDSNIYVIYNGRGVPQSKIDDDFIEEYFDVETGEITLMTNDNSKDYEVAYITSYETYYVTSSSTDDDKYTINDSYTNKNITLDSGDCTVSKASMNSKGEITTSSTTLSTVGKNKVVSVAQPFDTTEGTQVVISDINLKNASVEEMSGDDYVTLSSSGKEKEYKFSDYFYALKDKDSSTYSLAVGDVATFYLDFQGNIVYFTKSDVTDPYAYVLGFKSANGLNGTYQINLYTITPSTGTKAYPLASSVRFNGKSMSGSEVETALSTNADIINEKNGVEFENGDFGQLITYKTKTEQGVTCISDINTLDPYKAGKALTYRKASKRFDEGSSLQFTINTSTIVLVVPEDRSDEEEFGKKTHSYFTKDGGSYTVEPYEVENNVAKVVLVYGGSAAATIEANESVIFVHKFVPQAKNPRNGNTVQGIDYYKNGTLYEEDNGRLYTKEADLLSGISGGDVIKVALDGNGEIVKVQKVYVGGVLYDYDDKAPFDTFKADNDMISHEYNGSKDYYQVVVGTLDSKAIDGNNGTIFVVPGIVEKDDNYDNSNMESFAITSSTKVYNWDSRAGFKVDSKTIDGLFTATDSSDPANIVVIKIGSNVSAVYVLD